MRYCTVLRVERIVSFVSLVLQLNHDITITYITYQMIRYHTISRVKRITSFVSLVLQVTLQ